MTFEAFARTVKKRAERTPFLRALYDTLDEYQSVEHQQAQAQPACHKGCDMCCHQTLALYVEEMEFIREHLRQMASPVKRRFRERIRQTAREWLAYAKRLSFASHRLRDPLQLCDEWLGKRCPFLEDDGSCGVHEVRPIQCRTTTSPTVCADLVQLGDGKHSVQMRYQCERWANDMLANYFADQDIPGPSPMPYLFAERGERSFKF